MADPTQDKDPTAAGESSEVGGRYPNYVLGVLTLVYVFNFLDRNIISILNEEIKADLNLSDAQMGFLYGTAFAVFYALFGIPLGRLADVWIRRSLISAGVGFWSLMTALSGLSGNFLQMAAARIGVGVGEASATPAAFSMLSDYFPVARRATVLALYSGGIYLGAGLGLFVGGQIVERWNQAYPPGSAPFGLAGWQVAYFVVGLPGLLMALWVRSLREPVRGQADGIPTATEPHPFREFFRELRAVLPPLTIFHLALEGGGRSAVLKNGAAAALIAILAAVLSKLTGDLAQWVALGIGLYATVSWMQALSLRDAPTATLLLRTPSFRWLCVGFAFLAFTGYGVGYWTPPFFLRNHGVDIGDLSFVLGGASAAGGLLGVTLGGLLADRLRKKHVTGRLWVAVGTAVLPVPVVFWLLTVESTGLAYAINFLANVLASMWIGAGASTVQDLVLPRMRASAAAFYLLVITFIGLALGPYTIGKLADVTGSLRTAMMLGMCANGVGLIFILCGMRTLARDESSLRDRARAAGEALP